MSSRPRLAIHAVAACVLAAHSAWAAPADRVPTPRAEPCITLNADPEEGEMVASAGLSYEQVKPPLNAVIQSALYCGQPSGMCEVHLTFELLVGCNGLVSSIETIDDGNAPATYVTCVSDVIKKADFPAHDMPDGMPVTYPVNVSW